MEKKFRTLSACLRRGRLSILFALQNGHGTPAATREIAPESPAKLAPQRPPAWSPPKPHTRHPGSSQAAAVIAPRWPGSTAGTRQPATHFDYFPTAAARTKSRQSRF